MVLSDSSICDCKELLVEFPQYICADVGNCTATTPRFTSDQLTTRSDLKRVEVRHRIASHPGCCRPPPIRPTDYIVIGVFVWRSGSGALRVRPHAPASLARENVCPEYLCCWVAPPAPFRNDTDGVKTTVPRLCVLTQRHRLPTPPPPRDPALHPFPFFPFFP